MSRMVRDHIGGAANAKTTFVHLNLQACGSSMIFHKVHGIYNLYVLAFLSERVLSEGRMAGVGIVEKRHKLERQHFGERREEKEKGEVASLSGWRYVTG